MIHRIIIFSILIAPILLWGQTSYSATDGSEFRVDGTSTLSDWTATTQQVEATVQLSEDFTSQAVPANGTTVEEVSIRIAVSSLDGGRGQTMNDKILNAFQASVNPDIVYELETATVTGPDPEDGQRFLMTSQGTLNMAGQSHPIEVPLTGKKQADGSYLFQGKVPVKMTDYGMEPPSAMFGQIVSGDKVVVGFDLKVTAQ